MKPRLRQMLPLVILPAVLLAALAVWHWSFLVPVLAWGVACFALGAVAAKQHFGEYGVPATQTPLVGLAAMVMHFAWSSGFWLHLMRRAVALGKVAQ